MKRPEKRRKSSRDKATVRTMLEEHRRTLSLRMLAEIRAVRAEAQKDRDTATPEDLAQTDVDGDIDMTLIQMRSDTLISVEKAIRRLDQGRYGRCAECGEPIAPERLRALPFALRCLPCETERETGGRDMAQPHGALRRLAELD